ncbi:MAG: hypothetical protein IT438_01980 [Phycisphaerales bacterium]|nr:hypothetical protein [Phycisphaerales bacterium]
MGDSTVRIRVIERCEANEASTRFQAVQDEDGALRHALLPALASPFTAWRARMTLGDAQVPGGADVLSTIDANETYLWAAALDRLSLIDDDLSRSVFGRLTSLADFGLGTRLPVWLQSGPALAQLRADLLSDDITADQRSARARAWLDAQPAAAAWVCDDAGLRDARTAEPICTVAFVNLSDNPVSVSAVVEGSKDAATTTSAPELMVVGPWTAARLHALAPTGAAGGERAVVVRAGGWERRLPVLCDEILARPPGLPIGPFVLEISSDAVAAGSEQGPSLAPIARPVPREWATAGLLMSEPVRRDAGSPSSQTEREAEWTIYLECAHPKSDSVEGDRVRILFGPTEGSAGVREIVIEPASAGVRVGAPQTSPDVRIVRREDRWVCWVRVPADAIEEDGRLRLGLVRESTPGPNTAAIISSWPRPMLPGSAAGGYGPGRLCIDLTQWSRVGGDR